MVQQKSLGEVRSDLMRPEFQPVQPEIRSSAFTLKLSVGVMLLGHAMIHDIPYTILGK